MKKRLFCVLLCAALICALLPVSALGAETIDSISITITAPMGGDKPDYSPVLTERTSLISDYSSDGYIGGVRWRDATTGTYLNKNSTFVAGHEYTLRLAIMTDDGYEFQTDDGWVDVLVSVNDSAYFAAKPFGVKGYEDESKYLNINYTFTAGTKTVISSVDLTVTPPEVGQTPDYKVTVNTPGCRVSTESDGDGYVNGVGWWSGTGDDREKMAPTDKFEAGKTYHIGVVLVPEGGYVFANSDNKATFSGLGEGTTVKFGPLYCFYDFDPLPEAAKTPESLAVTTPPTKTEYKAGESFESKGMVVTVTYEDKSTAAVTGYTVAPSVLTAETKEVTISYTENEKTVTAMQAVTVEGEADTPSFSDVPANAYYAKAVAWAVSQTPPITSGIGDGKFGPGQSCTRAQAVTFLWNAAGKSEVSGSHPFTDVKAGSYYEKAVIWAVKNGITNGTSATTFGPNDTCTRGQIVTFLYNAAEKPAVSGSHPFTDVKAGSYYEKAVIWAVNHTPQITAGTSATTFGPANNCTRGQIVTFLWNAVGKP